MNVDFIMYLFPREYSLIGINYEKVNMLANDEVKVCHQLSMGLLFLILEISIYEKGSI